MNDVISILFLLGIGVALVAIVQAKRAADVPAKKIPAISDREH